MNYKKMSRIIGNTIYKYKMIQPDDKVLVAVSGGKDSLLLLYDLLDKQRRYPFHFEIKALHIRMDYCDYPDGQALEDLFVEWGVPYEIKTVNILSRLKPGRKMNCYWCASQRRMELIKYAQENGFNRIALGHHLDDIVETFLMNIMYKGELSTMLPKLDYDKYPISIIRPLAELHESDIAAFAEERDLVKIKYICPYSLNSKRLEVKNIISTLTNDNPVVKSNIYNAMSNVNGKYLL